MIRLSQPLPALAGTIRCLLCEAILAMEEEEDTEKYDKHLKTQHGVCYNRSWLIEQTLAVVEEPATGTKLSSNFGEAEVAENFVTVEEEAERIVAFESVGMEVDPLEILALEERREKIALNDETSHSAKSNCDVKKTKFGIRNFDENENINGRKNQTFDADKTPFENLVKSALRKCSVNLRNHHLKQMKDGNSNLNISCPSNEQNLEVDPDDLVTDVNSNVIIGAGFLDFSFESTCKEKSRDIQTLSNGLDGCANDTLEADNVPCCLTPPSAVPKCPIPPSPEPSCGTQPSPVPSCPTPPYPVPRCLISPSPVPKCPTQPSPVPRCPTQPSPVPRSPTQPTPMPRCPTQPSPVPRSPTLLNPVHVPRCSTPPLSVPRCSTPPLSVPRCRTPPHHVPSSQSADKYEYKCPFPDCDFQTDLEGMKTGAAAEHGIAVHQVRPWEVKKHGLKWKRVSLEKRTRQMFGDA